MPEIMGWGRYPRHRADARRPRNREAVAEAMAAGPVIARGLGRAYGDSAIGVGTTLDMTAMNRMLAFDPETGLLEAEAGVALGDIIRAFLPRGWFVPVTPGTKFVTLGGAIAAHVHGKNHHGAGGFGAHVAWLDLLCADGEVRRCGPEMERELFEATVGGMGLSGVILRAAFRLMPVESAWIRQTTLPVSGLDAMLEALEREATYSVAWVDCLARGDALGRGLVMLGEHAGLGDLRGGARRRPFQTPPRRPKVVPIDAPGFTLNALSVGTFNALYRWNGIYTAGASLVDWDSYFYPLDAVLGWNRIYGPRGFMQFQCVLPAETSCAGLTRLLKATAAAGEGSFLAVLKRMGDDPFPLAFPMSGHTLTLDFPVRRDTLRLMDRLDRIVLEHGGRFYLAKDARMARETLEAADPRFAAFARLREARGWRARFVSRQSERLGL